MMRFAIFVFVSVQLASCAPHVARGSRKGSMGMGSTMLTSSFEDTMEREVESVEEEISTTTPMMLLFAVSALSVVGATLLIEHRRQHSSSTWMADQRALALYRGMVGISLAQGCLAVYKIACGDLWEGCMDLGNSAIGYYATRPEAISYLQVYLAVSGVTTIIDILGLLWNGIICIDLVRPALCVAGIYFAREFLIEKKEVISKYDGLLGDGKTASSPIDNLLNLVVSSSMVQQAMIVLGVIDMDALLFGLNPSSKDRKSEELSTKAVDTPACPEDDLTLDAPADEPADLAPVDAPSDLLDMGTNEVPTVADLVSGEEAAPCDLLELQAPELPAPAASDLLDMGGQVEFASDAQDFVF
jgi:hypothetical protein